MQLPVSSVDAYQAIAALITSNPPEWLARYFMSWSPTIFLSFAVEKRQPTRAEMKKILNKVHESAALLQRALAEPAVCEFLDAASDRPMGPLARFGEGLNQLGRRSANAAKLPALVNSEGKAKSGKGKAAPDNAITAQEYCALFIAETWKWFRGEYPPPRNKKAAEAAEIFWKLAGADKMAWGNDTLVSWRHHFKKLAEIPAEAERADIRHHLRESEHAAAQLAPTHQAGN